MRIAYSRERHMRLRSVAFGYRWTLKAMRDKQLKRHTQLTALKNTMFILLPEFCRLVPCRTRAPVIPAISK